MSTLCSIFFDLAECLEGCDEDDQSVKAATVAAQYSLLNYGRINL